MLRAARDASPATWICAALHPFGRDVGSVIPDGFEAYARVFHPAYKDDASAVEQPVRWHDIAAANGRTLAEEMYSRRFDAACHPTRFGPDGEPLWDQAPTWGTPLGDLMARMISTLRVHTSTPERCWFGVWEGRPPYVQVVERGPRFGDAYRKYHLVQGDIDDALLDLTDTNRTHIIVLGDPDDETSVPSTTETPAAQRRWYNGPNYWWPDDRAWCVASEIDFTWTYVGGSRACIETLLADPELEAVSTHPLEGNLMEPFRPPQPVAAILADPGASK